MQECTFCKIIKRKASGYIIDEDEEVIVFLALEGHPLVVTKKHIPDIYSLDDITGAAIMRAAIKVSKVVRKTLQCDGINLVQANEPDAHQDVFHFHMHIKPRWKNDTVTLEWEQIPLATKKLQAMQEKIIKAL